MSLFEDVVEAHYQAATYRDHVSGPCEVDTLVEALQEVTPQHRDDAVVILDRQSAATISEHLGDDVHVTVETPHALREHVYLVPKRIEQALGGETMVLTEGSQTRFGLVMDPSCVTYANEVIDPAGVVGISWVVDDE
ncbi:MULTISPECIES: hypothetical protein [Haloferacaceae]|uniref:Lactate utilization protein C n=1 Tax=Halorubrum glutamatedens TaxID=2707018 RepID=A0ABD5QTB0_9EURY|nr:hypothetical protein [Halobellus captivus]